MEVVRHEARLNVTRKEGGSLRAVLEQRAAQGSVSAIDQLTPPDHPEQMEYLLDWSRELVGRSGVGMDGLAPLTWEAIDAWARRTGRNPTPDECSALMLLDGVFRHPESVADEPATIDVPKVATIRPWPTRKPETERAD